MSLKILDKGIAIIENNFLNDYHQLSYKMN